MVFAKRAAARRGHFARFALCSDGLTARPAVFHPHAEILKLTRAQACVAQKRVAPAGP
jgi:hypothetical protein